MLEAIDGPLLQGAMRTDVGHGGCERHLANGVPANGKPTSPYPAWGVARSRPCHVIPLAGLAGVYARA